MYPDTPMPALSLSASSVSRQHFSSFSDFRLNFCMANWRPFGASFSLNSICKEISGCLVSNGSGLVNLELRSSRYHAHKGGDSKLKNSKHLSLKNSYLLIQSRCRRGLLVEIS